MRVAIYCGSREGNNPIYIEKAIELGRTLAENGIGVVYGGANNGVMGAVADAALAEGGEVIGVTPAFEEWNEVTHLGLTELHYVSTMHERKALMIQLSDMFIALPGGAGTMDEFFDVFTLTQIGQQDKAVCLYNVNHFYEPLRTHFDKMVEEGFMPHEHLELLHMLETPQDALDVVTKMEAKQQSL